MRTTSRTTAGLLGLLLALFLASGCTSDESPSNEAGEQATNFPLTVTGANGEVSLQERPQRVVSLSPTATESLFAIGAGEQVVAVDDQSDFPAEAPRTSLSGFTPNAEAIAQQNPDLVVLSNDMNGIVDALNRLEVPTLVQEAATDLDGVYSQIETLGRATGNTEKAQELTEQMRTEINQSFEQAEQSGKGSSFYHEVDPTYYSVTSDTFVGSIYERLGLQNIADAADTGGSGYPQLSSEYIVQANPSLIFLADVECCGENAQTVAARPGWSNIAAVRNGNIILLDDDIASRWGPRTVELVKSIAEAKANANEKVQQQAA